MFLKKAEGDWNVAEIWDRRKSTRAPELFSVAVALGGRRSSTVIGDSVSLTAQIDLLSRIRLFFELEPLPA